MIFEAWLRAKQALISQTIKLAAAIRYPLSRWQGLARFIDALVGKLRSN
jgi:transposase